jgi:hypothetical protein
MNLRSVLPVALLASFVLPAAAQSTDEEQVQYTLPTDEWYVPKSTLSFGVRLMSSGANVKFGNLGVINPYVNGPLENGDRAYADGFVRKDQPRLNETDVPTTPTDPDTTAGSYTIYRADVGGGRYEIRTRTRQTTDEGGGIVEAVSSNNLAYNEPNSRVWQAASESQIVGGRVQMSNYTTTTLGNSIEKDEGMNAGIEMSLARALGKFGQRIEWGVTAGIALNTMNAKTGGTVRSSLFKRSDFYTIVGTLPTGSWGGPTYDNNGNETTAPVVYEPAEEGAPVAMGEIDVHGNWQVKGAYFMVRVGPSIRTQVTDTIGLNASIGVAGAYSGSRYSVMEQIEVALPDGPMTISDERWDADSKLLAGFYADVNVEWAATERTGLFAGVSMQQFGTYEMSVAGRTATIDLGNAIGLRGGISVRF